jgi:FkbM family methyltransferase
MHEIAKTVRPGEVVFDVGAHSGEYAAWFVEQGARVVCIEPQPAMVARLRERFEGQDRVVIVPKGLAEAPGWARMSVSTAEPALSTFTEHWKTGRHSGSTLDERVDVEMTTLDALVAEHGAPVYCKIDVEGFELPVIRGLSRKVGVVSFEFTTEFLGEAMRVVEHLLRLGYTEFNFSVAAEPTLKLREWIPFHELVLILFDVAERCQKDGLWGDIYAR